MTLLTGPVRRPPVSRAVLAGRVSLLAGAAVALLTAGLWLLAPDGDLARDLTNTYGYPLVQLLAALTAAAAAVRSTDLARVWWTVSAALLLYGTGDLLLALLPGLAWGDIGAADLAYFASYLALAALPWVLLRSAAVRPHPGVWLHGVVTGLGALALAMGVVVQPFHDPAAGGQAMLALVYLCADVALLALLATLVTIVGHNRVVLVAGLAVACLLAGDLQYYGVAMGAVFDTSYLLAPLLLAGLAHRAPVTWRVARDVSRPRLELGGQALPAAGMTAALVVLLWASVVPAGWVAQALAAGCLVLGIAGSLLTLVSLRSFDELRAQALADPLTGIGNRRALDVELARLGGTDRPGAVALLVLDVDSFKDVNDDAGHAAGDEVLCEMAHRLVVAAGPGTTVVRLEGDTFAVCAPGTDVEGAEVLARQLAARLRQPVHAGNVRVRLTVSVGGAVGPATAGTALLRQADTALAEAKRGADAVVVHLVDPHSPHEVSRLQLADELHTALDEGQLVLWFQPQLHLASAGRGGPVTTVAGCEALVRWEHPTRGLLGPAQVLAAAEHGRLMPWLSHTVLDLALAAAATWWEDSQLPVSVNLSASDLEDERLPDHVAALLVTHRLPPWALTVEVVEDTVMLEPDRARAVLGRLRDLGVLIAVDDFGTGYSSLAYLHELPVDELKLDRSLTRDVAVNPAATAIVRHSIALAHELGLTVVGEGVEEDAVLETLVALGCDSVQGYLTGRPMPAAAWACWLAERTAVPAVGVRV